MKKKILVLTLILLLLAGTVYAAENIKVIVNGREVQSDVPAQVINGRTMVPLRAVSESLGADVQWDAVNRTVNITKNPSGPVTQQEWTKLMSYELLFLYYDIMDSAMQSLGGVSASQNLMLYWAKFSGNPDNELLNTSYVAVNSLSSILDKTQGYIDGMQRILPPSINPYNKVVIDEMINTKIQIQNFNTRDKLIKDELKKYYETGNLQDGKKVIEDARSLLLDVMNYQNTVKDNKDKYRKLMDDYMMELSAK